MSFYVDNETKTYKVWNYLIILYIDHFQKVMILQALETTDLIVGQIHNLQGF